jgi:site-specific DNA-methyltransferase (adenine-specific)
MENLKNKVIQGDCLEVMKGIPDKSIDMILCDLPYGTTACKWDTIIPFEPLWEQYKRIIKDNGAIVLTASQPFTSALVMSNIEMFKYSWVWVKEKAGNFQQAKKRPCKFSEDVVVFCKTRTNYNPQNLILLNKKRTNNETKSGSIGHLKKYIGDYNQEFTNYPSEFLLYNNEKGLHESQKPVALFEYLIKTYTNEGDLVLDNCAGSGTTGVACKNTGRDYVLIEKEPEYIEIINKRLQ